MTPFGTCPTRPCALSLCIEEYSCACSNQWTHSYYVYYGNGHYGGTPTPKEASEWKVIHATTTKRAVAHCFRCLPLGTPLGLQYTKPTPKPASTKPLPTLTRLEDDIFS